VFCDYDLTLKRRMLKITVSGMQRFVVREKFNISEENNSSIFSVKQDDNQTARNGRQAKLNVCVLLECSVLYPN
jgi:hypothetical protein